MAMIKCPECGREISDRAKTCPGCGISKEDIQEMLAEINSKEAEKPDSSDNGAEEKTSEQPEKKEDSKNNLSAYSETVVEFKSVDFSIGKKSKMTLFNIHCTECGISYNAVEQEVCPECGTPVFMLGKVKEKAKKVTKSQTGAKKKGTTAKKTGTAAKKTGTTAKKTGTATKKTEAIVKTAPEPTQNKVTPVKTISKVGEYYKMGRYGGEEINWRVLAVEDGKALLISEKGLDAKVYNEKSEDVTWETCTLRKWLNGDFYNSSFGAGEREKIRTTIVTAEKNPLYGTDSGKDTEDKVFLLSIQEAEKYFSNDEDRKAYPTEYAKANGAYEERSTKCCWWWLRSPGDISDLAAYVHFPGWIYHDALDDLGARGCVRPALWVNL